MMKKITVLALAALVLAACADDKQTPESDVPEYEVVGFEQAQLGDDGFIWGKSQAAEQDDKDYDGNPIRSNIFYGPIYEEGVAEVFTYFTDYGHTFDTWNGFVISNHTDRQTEGYTNDKSVYAEAGANGSKQFAMAYYGADTPNSKGIPVIRFSSPTVVNSVAVALPTYVYYYFAKSIAAVQKPAFTVVVDGYPDAGQVHKEVSVVLVEGQDIRTGWVTADLSSLGVVSRLEFRIECADQMAPLYVCVDDLTYKK